MPYTPDYRWLLDRDDSPWYPTARLFRQDEYRDYRSVIDRIRTELHNLIGAWRPTLEVAEAPLAPSASPDEPALTS